MMTIVRLACDLVVLTELPRRAPLRDVSVILLREYLNITSLIPAAAGRPTLKLPTGKWRYLMATQFDEETYGQRWQVETVMFMLKRHLGCALTARKYQTRRREMNLRAITHNITILLPPELFYRAGQQPFVPCCEITDWPAFAWRGFMHDVGRNFQDVELLKRFIDVMAEYKLNVFHAHLTDKPGYRIECLKYPQLNATNNYQATRQPGKFYTYAQLNDLVAYCRARHIRFLPEIDMPGHSDYFKRTFKVSMQDPKGMEILTNILNEFFDHVDVPDFHMGMFALTANVFAKPLKVYIMAGQSNMQGKAQTSTLPAMAWDPQTKALYDKIIDADGNPRVFKNVCVAAFSSFRGRPTTKHGPLTVGFGNMLSEGDTSFGTEVAFGATLYDHLKEPILIIKTSWGGKNLHTDFRPPSAGPYYPDPSKVKDKVGNHRTPAAVLIAEKEKKQHAYYRKMMEHIKTVLADLSKYCAAYDPNQGYELAGFIWFQGFNDMIAGDDELYRATKDRPQYAAYSDLLAHFIRDVRKDLNAPQMPFVIGVIGLGGVADEGTRMAAFQKAMAAPAQMPEFKGNVVAVETGKYWDKKLSELDARRLDIENTVKKQRKTLNKDQAQALTQKLMKEKFTDEERNLLKIGISNAGFHYFGSAKIYSRIGEAFAKALLELNKTN